MADKTLTVRILADTDNAERGLDNVEQKTGGLGDAFKNAAALAATYLAGKALAAVSEFVSDSVEAYSDLNESLNALEVQYGEHAEGIEKLGEKSARSIGASNAEFNEYAVSISAFAEQIAGDGGDVVGVVDTLSKRTADFASVMNLDFGEASQKFRSGLAGESEPLRQFGIDVSAAKVEAVALSEGIWDGTGAMSESQKVQARFAAIMRQTDKVQGDFANTADDYANAQRIAAAETENVKARVGEALVPFEQLRTSVELLAAKALGIFSTQIQELTGNISSVDSAIQQFEIHMGTSADTAAAALTINREYGEEFDDLIPRLNLSRDQLIKLRDADEEFLRSIGLTSDEVDELADVVGRELASSMTDAERTARMGLTPATEELGDAQDDAARATDDHTSALEAQSDVLRTMRDPVFAIINATADLEQAQRDYDQAVEDGDPAAQLDAVQRITDATLDQRDALGKLREQGIDPTSSAARDMFRDMGLTPHQIDLIVGQFRSIQDKLPVIDLDVLVPSIEYQQRANTITPHTSREVLLAEGALVRRTPGGISARIGEGMDDEAVAPVDQLLGMIRDAVGETVARAGADGPSQVIELHVDATRGQSLDGWAILEALQRIEQTSGPLPIRVRT